MGMTEGMQTAGEGTSLELDDIQSGALHERPSPYVGRYLLLRIDDRAGGRELVRRLHPFVDSGRPSADPAHDAWITVAFTYHGLRALGVPQGSLDSFAPEFQQGMAARAADLGDVGDSSPEHWEKPLGTAEVHVAVAVLSPDAAGLEALAERARDAHEQLPGVEVIWRQDCYQLPTGRTSFGFKDGIGQPAVEGSGISPSNPQERPIKAGEIILGYPDETGELPPMPTPEVLGRNGTYVVFRKLHTRVAAYRQYLHAKAASREDEELLGAKMVGRWQSGAPLVLAPEHDDPELGADPERNNEFLYGDDLRGFKCPAGAHARRANPRDALDGEGSVNVRLHRMIRRGTSYGPMLPAAVLDDYVAGGRVALITLNRPHADNAITTEMGARLTEILETIAVRAAVRVAVITGAGTRAFSVGSDLRQRKNMSKEDWLRQRQDFDRTLYTVRQLRKPIFAAVNGIAYGGGSELAQSTDFIIASENASFGQPEAMIGLSAGGGSPVFLPRVLPPGKALQMLMTGDPITAQAAHRLGMVNELHPQAELMDAAYRIAEKIASNSPTSVQAVKRAVRMGEGQPIERSEERRVGKEGRCGWDAY